MLRFPADRRTLVFVSAFFGLVGAAYVFSPMSWWIRVPLIAATCLLSFIGAVITHNTIHVPIFHHRGLNRAFQVVLTLVYGHPVSSFVPGHNLSHHRWPQSPLDVMRTTKARFRWNLLNQLLFAVIMAPAIVSSETAFTRAIKDVRPQWHRQLRLEKIILRLFQASMLSLAIVLGDPLLFVLHIMVPYFYAAWGVIGINYVQHDGTDAEHPYNHSRNFVGRWVNWWTFNNGFHGMHHVEAELHWSLLPQAHREQLGDHIHPALEQRSLLAYVLRAYVWPGRRLDYLGQPVVLPEPVPDADWVAEAAKNPAELPLGAVADLAPSGSVPSVQHDLSAVSPRPVDTTPAHQTQKRAS